MTEISVFGVHQLSMYRIDLIDYFSEQRARCRESICSSSSIIVQRCSVKIRHKCKSS